MAYGYAGKILKVDLTDRSIEEVPTEQYEEWGGGHGMGSALFWDLCEDKTVLGTDPRNVLTIMASPLSGTLAPSVAGRTEVQAIGLQSYPIGWYTRSNFGGRFSGQLKFAGWDGIAVLGRSDTPVWLNVVDGKVTLEDAADLWGLDTYETQERIWSDVTGEDDVSDWWATGASRDGGRSTQRPAVLTIGPNAEGYGPVAALIHDAGNGAGQGGFGGVFASKNLKAVSVMGTGSIQVADPNALMESRLWANGYGFPDHADAPVQTAATGSFWCSPGWSHRAYPAGMQNRPQACLGCVRSCRGRLATGEGNESSCIDFFWYDVYDMQASSGARTRTTLRAADIAQRNGINVWILEAGLLWIAALLQQGAIGPGMEIDSSLPFHLLGTTEFVEAFIGCIVEQTDIGADLALGLSQAAEKWGRLEQDLRSGILPLQEWGYPHHYDARTEVEWGYGSLMGSRDCNDHDFNWHVYWTPTLCSLLGMPEPVTAERFSEIIAKKCVPYSDPMMVDYSDEGIYSDAMAKTVAWHRHYTRYWKQSLLFCDFAWADFVNPYGPDSEGITGEGEPRFMKDVTGNAITFEEGMEIGRRIWNLDRAIWVLQGRHRDLEVFADYNYDVGAMPGTTTFEPPYVVPVHEDGEWSYKSVAGRMLDRQRVEEWKSKFFALEGWDEATGWPTRETLEGLGLGHVANELEAAGKLGGA